MEELIDKKEFWDIVLNGMSFTRYVAMVLFALIGAVVLFLTDMADAIKYDKRSPDQFNFRYMMRTGWPRFVTGMLLILVLIPHFGDLLKILIIFTPEEGATGSLGIDIVMTPALAFVLGINADLLAKKLVGTVRDRVVSLLKSNHG
jgi:hypothetical protein